MSSAGTSRVGNSESSSCKVESRCCARVFQKFPSEAPAESEPATAAAAATIAAAAEIEIDAVLVAVANVTTAVMQR